MSTEYHVGEWRVVSEPDEGGRLGVLSWRGHDLLTARPGIFREPKAYFGRYETRPVYGYDDCFPSTGACRVAGLPGEIPDHGELCWLPAVEYREGDLLRTTWNCRGWPGVFIREIRIEGDTLRWKFRVTNAGDRPLSFLHAMHGLMPAEGVCGLCLPACRELFDEIDGCVMEDTAGCSTAERLLATPVGTARMWLLRGVAAGEAWIAWKSGVRLTIRFPSDRFSTLGIWWNRRGYPGGPDTCRDECALEPMPGLYSSLDRCLADGNVLTVGPQEEANWVMEWVMTVDH